MKHTVFRVLVCLLVLFLVLPAYAEDPAEDPYADWLNEYQTSDVPEFADFYQDQFFNSMGGYNYAPNWRDCILSPHERAEAGGVTIEISDILFDAFDGTVYVVFTSDAYRFCNQLYLDPMFCDLPIESWPSGTCFVEVSVREGEAYWEPEARDYHLSADGHRFDYFSDFLDTTDETLEIRVSLIFWENGAQTKQELFFSYPGLPLPWLDSVQCGETILNEELNREIRAISFRSTALRSGLYVNMYIPGDHFIWASFHWDSVLPTILAEDGAVLYTYANRSNSEVYIARFPDAATLCWYDYEADEILPGSEVLRLIRNGDRLLIEKAE